MARAYLEPNIINWARRAAWSGDDLRNRLSKRNFEPQFGVHGIYELARGFLAANSQAAAQHNFRILVELDPTVGPTPEMLFEKELDRLRTGARVIPVLDELNGASAKFQIAQMAAGRLEDEGAEFVRRREARIDRDSPLYIGHQLREARDAVAAGAVRPKNFEDVLARFDEQIPKMILQILGSRITRTEAIELHARLPEFPALCSAVRANLYLWTIPLVHDAGAARDKTDDYRHIIEASYADVFVIGLRGHGFDGNGEHRHREKTTGDGPAKPPSPVQIRTAPPFSRKSDGSPSSISEKSEVQ